MVFGFDDGDHDALTSPLMDVTGAISFLAEIDLSSQLLELKCTAILPFVFSSHVLRTSALADRPADWLTDERAAIRSWSGAHIHCIRSLLYISSPYRLRDSVTIPYS